MQLFYYGTQDVPVPPRRASVSSPRSRPFLCESCRAEVTAEAIERGVAVELFGLVLCGECRKQLRGEDHVELYFCGECGVSVPVFVVETGEAVEGDGRILCVECRAARRRPRRWRAAMLLAAGYLLLAFALRPAPPAPPVGPDSALLIEELLPAVPAGPLPRERLESIEARVGELAEARDGLEHGRGLVLAALEEVNSSLLLGREEFRGRTEELASFRREVELRLAEMEGSSNALNPPEEDSR